MILQPLPSFCTICPFTLENLKFLAQRHHKNGKPKPSEVPLNLKKENTKTHPHFLDGIAIWIYTYLVTWTLFFLPNDLLDKGINVFKQKHVNIALGKWCWSTVLVWLVIGKALGTCKGKLHCGNERTLIIL